jgi:hypothetical protein
VVVFDGDQPGLDGGPARDHPSLLGLEPEKIRENFQAPI